MTALRPLLAALALIPFVGCVDPNALVGFGCDGSACAGDDAGTTGANGSACRTSGDCGSGFCVAGVCCTNGCSGACETCEAPGRVGTCTLRPAGAACGSFTCDGVAGTCREGCDTASECASGHRCVGAPGGACVDDDECATADRCGAHTTCTNTPGSFTCGCAAGFMGLTVTGASTTCLDVNECSAATVCGSNALCTNTEGSFECSCAVGFFGATTTGGPASCSAVNNCTSLTQCGANATCASTATSYTCTCTAGFSGATTTGMAATCADADECATAGICGEGADCQNAPGSFTCTCRSGFTGATTTGTAATCTDVDECATSGLCGSNGVCTNSPPGRYTCGCAAGFFGTPVVGGPASCSPVNNCTGSTACGANATCATTMSSYTCTCDSGYMGATTTGAPATCTDVDECAQPNACGANATCANTAGSFTCACEAGFTGPTTTGMPTTCTKGIQPLGQAQGVPLSGGVLTATLTAGAAVGGTVIATFSSASSANPTVVDSRGNTWVRVTSSQACGSCGTVGVFRAQLTTALLAGDTVALNDVQDKPAGLWVAATPAFPWVDQLGSGPGDNTLMPTAQTNLAVTDPFELVVGVIGTGSTNGCNNGVLLVPNAPGVIGLQYGVPGGTGLAGYYVGSGLMGPQSFTATSPASCRFSSVVTTFYGGAPAAPTGLSLTHVANAKTLLASWTGGRGNGGATGCQLQVNVGTTWTSLGAANCDLTTSGRSYALPSTTGWAGTSWSNLAVRLVRVADGAILGTFPQRLTCTAKPSSMSATPTIDEDCDGAWDDHTCTGYTWAAQGTFGTTFTACTNTTGVATTYACNAAAEGVTRYTNGTSTGFGSSPAINWSSDQVGTACQGSFTGAAEWLCTGTGCTYF